MTKDTKKFLKTMVAMFGKDIIKWGAILAVAGGITFLVKSCDKKGYFDDLDSKTKAFSPKNSNMAHYNPFAERIR